MRKKTFRERVKFYLRIRWRAFRRRPLVFLRYLFTILFFRSLGIIICLFLTVIPLPLNHLLQNMFNLNLSLNSFKEIVSSVRKMAFNFNHMLPSVSDVLRMMNTFLTNVNPYNLINIVRDIPMDLRQFMLKLLDYLRERFKDLRVFVKSLWPPRNSWRKLRLFIRAHTIILKRIVRNILMMVFSLLFVKILFFMVIPLLGIGAVYVIGFNVSLIIIAVLSLISSQLGALIGRLVNQSLIKLYDYMQKSERRFAVRLLLISVAIGYNYLKDVLITIRQIICQSLVIYIKSIKLSLFIIYIYYKNYFAGITSHKPAAK